MAFLGQVIELRSSWAIRMEMQASVSRWKNENLVVMAATNIAIRKRFHIARASWDLQTFNTVPFYVIGSKGSVKVHLKPACEGSGIHGSQNMKSCPPLAKKLLQTACMKYCPHRVEGNPKLLLNLRRALFHVLCKLNVDSF